MGGFERRERGGEIEKKGEGGERGGEGKRYSAAGEDGSG